jgi:hypothetical protein
MTIKVIVGSGRRSGGSMTGGAMGSMGLMNKTLRPSFSGWYDNHKVVATRLLLNFLKHI